MAQRKNNSNTVEEILTPSEVAALFKIHVNTVYRLAEKGVIPGCRIGRGWRFSKSDILGLLSKKQRKASRSGKPLRRKEGSPGGR